MYWGRSESLNIQHESYTHNSAAHPCQVCDFITCLQGSISRQLLGRENCPMNLDMLSIYLVSPKCSQTFGIIAMTLKDIYSLLAAVGSLKSIGYEAELDHCHTNGGYCVRAICPPSARRPGSCFPEKNPCCKYMK